MTMGHRVAVLRDGLLQQCATPRELYDRPVNTFVAGFIGSPGMNLVTAPLRAEGVALDGLSVPLPRTTLDAAKTAALTEVRLGVRPESLRLVGEGEPGMSLKVELVEELGADAYVYGETGQPHGSEIGSGTPVVVRVEARRHFQRGATIHVTADPKEIHVFDSASGDRIGSRAGHHA
jgi:multiple sugar transport system ATP-binding protein